MRFYRCQTEDHKCVQKGKLQADSSFVTSPRHEKGRIIPLQLFATCGLLAAYQFGTMLMSLNQMISYLPGATRMIGLALNTHGLVDRVTR